MSKYKTCKVCGKQFKTCQVCEGSTAPSWKKYSDSFEHFDIYTTVILYTRKELSKEEAAERLKDYPRTGYTSDIQKYVDEIFYTPPVDEESTSEEEVKAPKRRRSKKQEADVLG